VTFVGLMLHNLWSRKVRTALTAIAVAVGVTTVLTLGIVTHSIRTTAAAVLHTGDADFTVAQKGVSDVLNSVLDAKQVAKLGRYDGVASVTGALIATTKLNASTPLFLEIGLRPQQLGEFGVRVVRGRAFAPNAEGEIMLGWRAADSLGKTVGDSIDVDGNHYRIVGLYSVNQAFADSGSMLPLTTLQAHERKPGIVTLAFVRLDPASRTPARREAIRSRIQHDNPTLTTVRLATEFGRVDRNLQLITALDRAATILAVVIGAIIVMYPMLLSFFERTREFGVLRAVGWARLRVVGLVVGEALLISLFGAAVGVALAYGTTRVLIRVPSLTGLLHPEYQAGMFFEALWVAAGIGFLGALYPGIRAALLRPLEALRRE
jgi:putative ABC transport system permease protein